MATMGFIQNSNDETPLTNSSIIVPETFTHSIAFGETGSGKTSSYIYPNLKNRIELGHGILLYDYKGKEHLSVKNLAHDMNRLNDVIEIGKPWGESINLIQKMDEDELDKFFDNILKHGEDSKYWQNSAKSLGQTILSVLKAIEGFATTLKSIDNQERKSIRANGFDYPLQRNLYTLVKVCKTFETLKSFISSLPNLEKKLERLIRTTAAEIIQTQGVDAKLKEKFIQLIHDQEILKITIEINQNSLDSFGEDSNENLTQNIMGSLISPLVSLSQNSAFNEDNFDITKALNEGKIIVINVESLSNAVMESLNNTILYELSKRTKSLNINPVSIFIDEVQRVVSKSTDLPIDVFREAKVDMFLATQNSALLKEKLKDEKFDALMGNLTRKFYYKSSNDEELETELSLKELDTFEYISSIDDYFKTHISSPLFLDDDKKRKIEFKYQKKLNVLNDYLYKHKDKAVILEYDSRLYKDNKIIAIDIKTKREYIMTSLDEQNIEHLHSKVTQLFENAKKESLEDENYFEDFLAS